MAAAAALSPALAVLGPCTGLSQRPELLASSALLQDFTPQEADVLGNAMQHISAQPGQVLIAEGTVDDWMMLLLAGTVDVTKRKVGAESDRDDTSAVTRLAVIKQGAAIGEMSMLDGRAALRHLHRHRRGAGRCAHARRDRPADPGAPGHRRPSCWSSSPSCWRSGCATPATSWSSCCSSRRGQNGEQLDQPVGQQFHRHRRQDQAHQPRHHVDAGLAQHLGDAARRGKASIGGQPDHHAIAHQHRQLPQVAVFSA
jgi:hypothetical protein